MSTYKDKKQLPIYQIKQNYRKNKEEEIDKGKELKREYQ
jgi:hypothetical protein